MEKLGGKVGWKSWVKKLGGKLGGHFGWEKVYNIFCKKKGNILVKFMFNGQGLTVKSGQLQTI